MPFPSLSLYWLALSSGLLFALYFLYRSRRTFVEKLPGPKSNSFIFGNLPDLVQSQIGKTDFEWFREYGNVFKATAPLGGHVLLIADPKAIHHIYHVSGYAYPRQRLRRLLGKLLSGVVLTSVEGEDHRRQRKVMQPSFGASESRVLLPIFSSCALKMIRLWSDLVNASPDESTILDLPSWISRATLDAIGLAAFDYEFGALDDGDNELSKSFRNITRDIFGLPSKTNILITSLLEYLPATLVLQFFTRVKSPRLQRLQRLGQLTRAVAEKLVQEKTEALMEGGRNKKDVMSSIVKANSSENAKTQLTEEEMYSVMQFLIIAGHETTANTLSWVALELSKHPDIQTRLRKEIRATEREIQSRGETELTAQDLESMPYLNFVVKEVLRFHPTVPMIHREAGKDDVLPLSKPVVAKTGEVLSELPVPKGTTVTVSIAVYNRIPEIFGEDADTFNPDRWSKIDETKKDIPIGVYANLFTFAGGQRSCIGWRFAVLELRAFIVHVINNFELSLAVPAERVRREDFGLMVPTLEGEVEKGCQLPVRIRFASREV